jgi:hypothetical protein
VFENDENTLVKMMRFIKMKLYTVLLFPTLVLFGFSLKAQSPSNPVKPPYYGTARYPYWGKYDPVAMTEVQAQPWVNNDGVVIGWDWSLPNFVKPPKQSTFSLLRTGLSTTELNKLQKPGFPCKPSVAFWISWKDLEAVQGTFTFSQLISNIKLASGKGYQSIVRIHSSATIFAPAWVGNLGIATFPDKKVTNYDVKDPRFHALYLKLVEAIGKSGIPQMPEVTGLYVGYASGSYGDEGIGPYSGSDGRAKNDTVKHVRERLEAWAKITKGVEYKVFMGGESYYGQSLGFGIRRGFVEHYMYNAPNDYIGQKVDSNGYLYVDESVTLISKNLFQGEENEEYGTDIASDKFNFRFGPTTESFNYRYFSSNIRILQMRVNELLNHKDALLPEMLAWVGQNLGRTIDEAPDVFCFLRETRVLSTDMKNFERWLYQRDAAGYTTTATKKIYYDNYQPINVRAIGTDKMHDKIAREGKKIGFNIDKNWPGIHDSLAFKVSLFDHNAGSLNLKYSNGNEIVTLTKPLLGDSLLKTYTFFVSDYENGANIGGKFDFTLEAGENTKSIVVSFVRVIQSGIKEKTVGIEMNKLNSLSKNSISVNVFHDNLKVSSKADIKKVDLYNISGTKVKGVSTTGNVCELTTSGLISGIYVVVAFDEYGSAERKKIRIN